MPRLDVYVLPGDAGRVVDVQADILADLATRVVVPLIRRDLRMPQSRGLNPVFEIDGNTYTFAAQMIASVPRSILRRRVASLADHRDAITRSLDILLIGF